MMRTILLLFCVATCAQAQLLITEVHPTPAGGEPEWVECVNATARSVDIGGWLICDARSCVKIPDVSLGAGGLVVLTRDASALLESRWIPSATIIVEVLLPSLNNSTDWVEIRDADSVLIDSMSYDMRRYVRGRSLERTGQERHNTIEYGWTWASCQSRDSASCGRLNTVLTRERDLRCAQISALDDRIAIEVINQGRARVDATAIVAVVGDQRMNGVTSGLDPGMAWWWNIPLRSIILNGQLRAEPVVVFLDSEDDRAENDTVDRQMIFPPQLGTVLINEVLADPSAGSCEYVEVWNGTGDTLDLDGWVVEDESHVRSVGLGLTRIPPLGYGIFAGDTSIRVRTAMDLWCTVKPSLQINSTTDLIVLRTPSGFSVDSMYYDSKYHHDLLPSTKGIALEKRSPLVRSMDRSAWTSSGDVSGGSPGRINSVSVERRAEGSLQANPSPFSSDPSRRASSSVITWKQPFEQAIARVSIYRPDGILVADLLNSAFIAREGGVAWNGTDLRSQRVAAGPYVVLFECVDASSTAVYRDRCLVVVGE